jgi:CRISPR-associated protein Csc2
MKEATDTIQALLADEFIVHSDFIGDEFSSLLTEVKTLISNEESLKAMLKQADDEAKAYFEKHIKKSKKEKVEA